ncbi:30S ribosomal protein S17 [bacterium]|jgi:small subunit ribosomal protein S17|nr:30S ribosomal protein S17 [bacterium]MBT3730341.1 30S ribosomal protein S17 [bacterium]MBT4894512.1 30S ribosomal protein S17 [bacterium]
MDNKTEQKNTTPETQVKKQKTLNGVVVSDKMTDTAVVAVERYVKHPKYGKFIKRLKKYKAHDKGNQHEIGDKVTIEQTRPISKDKTFKIIN